MTFWPVASWKVRVTGILPPSRVRSGSTPNTNIRERYRSTLNHKLIVFRRNQKGKGHIVALTRQTHQGKISKK